ncbi:hypothetical protein L3067_04035 [Xanthomonas sp. PPL568]|uniref:hypothetical protein n=1 Tax=Xanthomonas indica TaxID=2912242 RepID=UPI001F59FFA9|nr:hypothetical protein [Xanthomonas indica]MCI2243776.1 hypothetical protein [Xanthomonas indica]
MALNLIDTTTDHGSYKGDPANVAFGKVNDNDKYLEGLATGAAKKSGDTFSGSVFWAYGGRLIRIIDEGSGNAALQATAADGNSFAQLSMRCSTLWVDAPSNVRLNTTQLNVQGPRVGGGQYAGYILGRWSGVPGDNDDRIQLQYYRETNDSSTSWSAFNWRLGRVVDSTDQQFMEFHRAGRLDIVAGGQRFQFQNNGNATAPGSFVNGGSDPAIKDPDSLRPIQDATTALLGLNVRLGKYLPEFNPDGKERAFVMADDAMRASTPQVIIEEVIQGIYAGWATDQLIAYLVAAHQEAHQRELARAEVIESLAGRLQALEQRSGSAEAAA